MILFLPSVLLVLWHLVIHQDLLTPLGVMCKMYRLHMLFLITEKNI